MKNLYLPLNLNLNNRSDYTQKWYLFRGNHGTFIVGIKDKDIENESIFNFSTELA
ncbi:hypothetical protein QUW37_06565 [Ligilactobacillus aviarius]|uniref:hypothetical protein n=1 Tax=Ligilactobacillus TaxID=2767887 RepID=UPI0025A4AD90|nr:MULTISPECIES: hypothetical protein [Ligilactobacillus]MDM8278892.1 hypothetical protein [Ligilactobacillus aviarius]MDO3394036.1 hypothetical protein [Ligilactobacillus sp. 110_WCHN]